MFWHLFINKFKIIIRTKSMIFWTLIFPIVLGTFFNLAFANLTEETKFKVIDIAVVSNEKFDNENQFKTLLEEISKEADNQVFNIKYLKTEDEAKKELDNNNIVGYYIIEDKINIVIKKNGIEQTVMKYIVDNYYSTYSVIENIYAFNPASLSNELILEINKDNGYFKDVSNENVDFTVQYFYTLIGMVCMYGGFFGMYSIKETEANLSKRAARTSISPVHKLKALFAGLLVSLIIQYAEILILLGYLIFILGIDFGNQVIWILLLTFIGAIAGNTFGIMIGVTNRKSDGAKTAILLSVTMTCSFLAGMMIAGMKHLIARHVPILGKINPVTMITDALYSLYYYNVLDRYFYNIISLLIFIVVMIGISYVFIRRKKYDSI